MWQPDLVIKPNRGSSSQMVGVQILGEFLNR
jgi:hypothetical protein